mgnify:FL=1
MGFLPLAFDISVRERDIRDSSISSAHIADDILMLVKSINKEDSVCYVPYGPLLTPSEDKQGEFIESLSEKLKEYLLELVGNWITEDSR